MSVVLGDWVHKPGIFQIPFCLQCAPGKRRPESDGKLTQGGLSHLSPSLEQLGACWSTENSRRRFGMPSGKFHPNPCHLSNSCQEAPLL